MAELGLGTPAQEGGGEFPFYLITYFPTLIYFQMHAFTHPLNEMHGLAWCSKQNKVFLGFCFTRDLEPNLATTLEEIKA
jgi:hypothetical protein